MRFSHQGLFCDAEINAFQNRLRFLSSYFYRFFQRDPQEYSDGLALYIYARSQPSRFKDPDGNMARVWETPFKFSVFVSVVWYGPDIFTITQSGIPAWRRAALDFQEVFNPHPHHRIAPTWPHPRDPIPCKPVQFWTGNWPWVDPDDECNFIDTSLSDNEFRLRWKSCGEKAMRATGQDNAVYLARRMHNYVPCGIAQVGLGRNGAVRVSGCIDPQHSAAHELGHLMGLGHNDRFNNIMNNNADKITRTSDCENARDVVDFFYGGDQQCCTEGH